MILNNEKKILTTPGGSNTMFGIAFFSSCTQFTRRPSLIRPKRCTGASYLTICPTPYPGIYDYTRVGISYLCFQPVEILFNDVFLFENTMEVHRFSEVPKEIGNSVLRASPNSINLHVLTRSEELFYNI